MILNHKTLILDRQKYISEIAAKHGIIITEDDPIFSVVIMNDVLFKEYMNALDSLHEKQYDLGRADNEEFRILIEESIREVCGKALYGFETAVKRSSEDVKATLTQVFSVNLKAQREQSASQQAQLDALRNLWAKVRLGVIAASVICLISLVLAVMAFLK
ncbi:MAG: hypothetical protein EOP10_09495 [Proteobacteria bacterium]|nr:MAG: hypothetical protein EOP10_09495 [Pseudomonadota bacterium]